MTTDSKSRELIVNDFRHTLFVEAGAGSGKTTAMVSRIMKIIINGLADVREIVAITFTNEGAASLKSKILKELESAARERAYAPQGGTLEMLSGDQLDRVHTALQFLPLAPFSTIHAFCLTLLKARPVEAKIDPKFDMNTEGNVVWALDEAWMAFLLECASSNHPFMKFALERGIDLNAVQEMVRTRCSNPDLVLFAEATQELSDDEIKRASEKALMHIRRMYENIHLIEKDKPSRRREQRLDFLRDHYMRAMNVQTLEQQRGFLYGANIYREWSAKLSLFEQETAQLKELCELVRKREADFMHYEIAQFVEEFAGWFDGYKRATSSLYFDDLLFFTREMLRTNREVREYFKSRFAYLFIDETQDIDPLQTEIVFFLSEEAGNCAARWSDVKLAPAKLFLVGDPKQSIYKFRRADIAMYEEAKELVLRQGGKVLSLERNFRSSAPIIHFVNKHFEDSFKGYEAEQQLRLQPLYIPVVESAPHPSRLVKHIFAITSPDGGKAANRAQYFRLEGEKLVSFIRSTVADEGPLIHDPRTGQPRRVRFSDIMILMRTMSDVDQYERLLEEADIPHYQVGGKTFFNTEDIRGLAFALQAIDDPTNTVALFGALKSPVFGFSDQDLFDYVSSGKRLNIFSGGEEDTLSTVLRILRTLHYRREALRPSGVLKEIFDVSGLCHVALTEPNGVQKTARYFRLLELLNEIEARRTRSFRSVIDALKQIMNLEDPQLANVTIVKSAEDAVRITTIHKAKGLEAPIVIIANGKIRSRETKPTAYVLREEGKIVIPYQNVGGFYSRDPAYLLELETARDRCEEERLRYVAATRARDMLVICIPSAEEGQNTFNGMFVPSLMLNPLVESVRLHPPSKVSEPGGIPVDLQKMFDQTRQEQERQREGMKSMLQSIVSPFISVHETMEVDEAVFKMRRLSRGKGYGSVLHRVMQHYVSSDDFDAESIIDEWMDAEGVPRRHRKDLLNSFGLLRANGFVVEAKSSTGKYCEWEFFVRRDNKIVNGVIDLVYKDQGGEWTIVDYKTDDVSDPARKAALDEIYGGQVREYARAFEEVTGLKVSRTVLLYVGDTVLDSKW